MSLRYGRLLLLMCGLASAAGTTSCMQERPAINRVQPNFVSKLDFIPVEYAVLTSGGATPETITPAHVAREPIFYTQTTIINKPATTGFVGVTSYSETEKIRWEVTENVLFARRAYAYLNRQPDGSIGQQAQQGAIVAAYRIESHFDIRRDYNTLTGEEINVVSENTVDRPWWQRQFMRVDWSQNLISGYNSPLSYEEWSGQVQSEPVAVQIQAPNDANRPVFEFDTVNGEKKLTYFDVVNRATLHPETVNLAASWGPEFSNVPVCLLKDGMDCAPADLTFRVSFRRADPTRDYEPASLSEPLDGQTPWQRLNMDRFGVFDTTRLGFDSSQSGVLDSRRMHWASRHNMFVWHHQLAYGAESAVECNNDRDCANGMVCKIGNTRRNADHRGVCAALAINHLPEDDSHPCQTDDDCKTQWDNKGVSNTAVCDKAVGKCGEHFFRCGGDLESCATLTGDPQSRCDLAIAYTRPDNRGLCLMPFRQRQVRPITYHESPDYPAIEQDVTEAMAADWNKAFSDAVANARRHECEIENNIDPATVDEATNPCNTDVVKGIDKSPAGDARHAWIACHNPVWGTDQNLPGYHTEAEVNAAHENGWDIETSCGKQGTVARLGDLRYSMIGGIIEQDSQGYWGLANIASDIETGEMVAGRGAVWQKVTENRALYLVQVIKVLNGDLSEDELSQAQYAVESLRQLGENRSPGAQILDAPFRDQSYGQQVTQAGNRTLDRYRLPDAGWLGRSGRNFRSNNPNEPTAQTITARRLYNSGLLGDGTNRGVARRNSLRGTSIEQMLMSSQQVQLAPTAQIDLTGQMPATIKAASPFRTQSPAFRRAMNAIKTRLSEWECGYDDNAAFSDDVVLGLARRLKDGNPIDPANPLDKASAFNRVWNFRPNGDIDYNIVAEYLMKFIHQGVLAHEIGHSIGQRHNFTASADAVNYFDQYWKVRGKGHPGNRIRPRYEYLQDPADGKYMSEEETDGRIEEFSYASVMDYRGLNEDAHGLGRYDYAFAGYVYTGLLQAFKRVKSGQMDLAKQYYFGTVGNGWTTPIDLSSYGRGTQQIKGLHYSQIPDMFDANADGSPDIDDDNRFWVFDHETASTSINGWGAGDLSNTVVTPDSGEHLLVPYRFDSDNRAGLVWVDQRFDAGADAYESLHYTGERMLNYYFANSFSRLRTGFSVDSYKGREAGKHEVFRQCSQTLWFDLINFQDFFADIPGWEAYKNDPAQKGGYINQITTALTADTLVNLVLMPEVGTHNVKPTTDNVPIVTPDTTFGSRGIDVPINVGRFFESNWRQDVGFWWYEYFNRVGAFHDKVLALDTLSDPELALLGRDTPTDIRLFQLSFFSMYPDQMIRLFGGLLSEDYADFAPIIDTTDAAHPIKRTNLATLTTQAGRTINARFVPLDPQTHFTTQVWAAMDTISQFPATFDQRYMNYTRLWLDGSVEAIEVANPAVNTVTFTDPFSHVTFRALHFGTAPGNDGATVGRSNLRHPSLANATADEAGVAARMLLHANDLETLRQAATGDARTRIENELKKYIDLLHAMRVLTTQFGQGNISNIHTD